MPSLTGFIAKVMDEEKTIVPSSQEAPCSNASEDSCTVSESGLPLNQLRTDLLDFLVSNDKAHFKSQQKDDPELAKDFKKKIAEELLDRSPAQFLSRFGHCLQPEHLKYFSGRAALIQNESYEIGFHLKRLERFYCKATNDVDVKNRRYDALQKMIASGSTYFSEDEMRQRNPYLYEQLVGQYLSEEERKEREAPDLANITFVNLLLMKISKDETTELKKRQEKEESGSVSDMSASDDENEESMTTDEHWNDRGTWGETAEDVTKMRDKRRKKQSRKKKTDVLEAASEISDEEKLLLMHEFVSTMYQSFIDGNDAEFDYSQIDSNPDYDCIDVRERDEEEKYFDAETPEDEEMDVIADDEEDITAPGPNKVPPPPSLAERREAQEKEEDTLDAFMKTIEEPLQTSLLTTAFQNLCHQSTSQPVQNSRILKKSHVIKINLSKKE